MIPGPFSYHRPATLADAVKLLSTLGDEARPLAGGHSLVPMMKLRLATPEHLVDLHGIDGLKGIRRDGDRIVIGAMTTQHELLASSEIGKSLPILHETALLIADPQVRYRGTIGGNVANGDPGNDMPALMLTLGASYRLEGPSGGRDIAASDFYQGAYFTALEPGEILTSISIPAPAGRSRLRLRKTQAQGRRLRHRGGGGRAHHGGRQGRQLRDRPHQFARNAAACGRRGQGRDRNQSRCGDAEKGRGCGGSDHVAGRGCPRSGGIPQACRRHHGDAGADARRQPSKLRGERKWQKRTSP